MFVPVQLQIYAKIKVGCKIITKFTQFDNNQHQFYMSIISKLDSLVNGKSFINEDFMLTNDYARELYHESAEKLPIIDYHCHLVPKMIAENYQFADLTEVWLGGDHYKWRATFRTTMPRTILISKPYEYN